MLIDLIHFFWTQDPWIESPIREGPLYRRKRAERTGLIRKKRGNRSGRRGSVQEAGSSKEEGDRITRWFRGATGCEDGASGPRSQSGRIGVGRKRRHGERRPLIKRFRGPGRCDDRSGHQRALLLGTAARPRHGGGAGYPLGRATGHGHGGLRRHAEWRHAAQRHEDAQPHHRRESSKFQHMDNIQKIDASGKAGTVSAPAGMGGARIGVRSPDPAGVVRCRA